MKFTNTHYLTESVSGMDQLEQTSQQKPNYVESDSQQDGKSKEENYLLLVLGTISLITLFNILGESLTDRQLSPEKLYRAAVLKNRFADTIFKAREKTLNQVGLKFGLLVYLPYLWLSICEHLQM